MNINIMNTQIFHKVKYDLKGHRRSFQLNSFQHIHFSTDFNKKNSEYKLYENVNFFKNEVLLSQFRFSDLITTFSYVLMETFVLVYYFMQLTNSALVFLDKMHTFHKFMVSLRCKHLLFKRMTLFAYGNQAINKNKSI